MAARAFALIIGIDDYKSGSIWNLQSCCDDAIRVKQWLIQELLVPKPHISTLLNNDATKRRIEDVFMAHFVNNPDIQRGDAMIIYFAGHGSSVPRPRDWGEGKFASVQVLCPYDHDTRGPEGRVAGISDRSLNAMLAELCKVKGDNITLILDCCFSPPKSSSDSRDRRYVRFTPTTKASSEDLCSGLWRGAIGQKFAAEHGFYQEDTSNYTALFACRVGEKAIEGKEGGRFTGSLLAATKKAPLHQTRCMDLIGRLVSSMGATHGQHPLCLGQHKDRVIFSAVPFVTDGRFVPVEGNSDRMRIEMGAIHGIVEGTEFSVHGHNCRGSLNPPLDNLRVLEVHPTWSIARRKSNSKPVGKGSWAQITRWNNRTPFRVHFKRTCASFFKRLTCRSKASISVEDLSLKDGLNIVRVESPANADISVGVHTHDVHVQNLDHLVPSSGHPIVRVEKQKDGTTLLDEAARFHLHLHRKNPDNPFRELVRMEIYRVDPRFRKRVGNNLLVNGQARILHDKQAVYAVVVHNDSDLDLWPYLAYMDTNGFGINLLYHPEPTSTPPPLRRHSFLEIGCGSGNAMSDPLSFPLPEHQQEDSGFLKLFVSTTYTSMGLLEQGSSSLLGVESSVTPRPATPLRQDETRTQKWDTALACLTLTQSMRQGKRVD